MRFVLVHGGLHGAWCWERLIPELERRGHAGVAMDLPGHGERRDEISTLDGYRDAVVEHLQLGDVLVGHSLGFTAAVLAADAFPDLRHLVSLAGPLAVEGRPIQQRDAAATDTPSKPRHHAGDIMRVTPDGEYLYFEPEDARQLFFHDCDPETAAWACDRLTPQRLDVLTSAPVSVPNFWRSDISRSCIRCLQDRTMSPENYDSTIARLGVDPLTIDSSHSPFLSRPAELAEVLIRAVDTQPIGPLSPGE